MTINDYLYLIPPMNREKPRFIAFLSAVLSQVSDLDDLRIDMIASFDLEEAEGAQLDILGRLTGVTRDLPFEPSSGSRTLEDEDFRLLIRARIARDHWDGSNAGFIAILHSLFPDTEMTFSDEQDMTLTVTVPRDLPDLHKELLEHKLLLPVPPGISIVVEEET